MTWFFVLNRLSWPVRIPIKWILFGLTLLAVCFPYPGLLVRHIRHWRNPSALVEPGAPAIQPFVEELRPQLHADMPASDALITVERYVYDKIPYDWDWNTWGTADYLPTVAEVVEKGREDCDGRAVLAASLLRNFGFKAEIVTDFAHVWVKTDHGEIMGPGDGKAVIATDKGLRLQPGAAARLPRALAYGIGPFPLLRELIVLAVMWLLMLRPKGGVWCSLVALAFLVASLLFVRAGGKNYLQPIIWMQLVGVANMLAGWAALLMWARHNARAAGYVTFADMSSSIPSGGKNV